MTNKRLSIEFLGTGTSCGVPVIGCQCDVCRSTSTFDNRLRASAIVRYGDTSLLIDCGPDFRTQMLRASSIKLDALLVTHIHYDHVGGMDDLRVYCAGGAFPVYARPEVIRDLKQHMPYCFSEHPYPGSPTLRLHEIGDTPFEVNGIRVTPLPVMHGKLPIVGYRIGNLAYITDAKTIPQSTIDLLEGVEVLVVNALRHDWHNTHMSVNEAMEVVKQVNAPRVYFTHMCHDIGLHETQNSQLPPGIKLAHDGLIVEV